MLLKVKSVYKDGPYLQSERSVTVSPVKENEHATFKADI